MVAFSAKFESVCDICTKAIKVGQMIKVRHGSPAVHASCFPEPHEIQGPRENCICCLKPAAEEFWKNHGGLGPCCWR